MGEGFLQIQQGGNNRMDPRVDWDNEQIVEGSAHTLMPHNFDPRLSDSELENRGRIGQIAFTDNCVAQLGLLEAKTCMFHCYDWTRAETTSVHLKWDFGVAFAVNEGLLNDPAEGILGVGLNHSQTAYYSTRRRNDPNPPSFLEVIPNKLNRVSPSQRKENVSIYFAIRLAPRAYYREPGIVRGSNLIQSWISFNGWPCKREPRWNERKIVVCGVDPEPRDWSVYLRSMRFMPMVDLESPRPRLTTAPEYLQAKLDFVDTRRPRGLCVILDTGASVTRLPPPFFQKLYHGLFRFKQNDPVGPNDAEPEAWVLPAWVKDKRIQIVYEFEGEGGQPVTIYGPFERFFYQHNVMASGNPMEALIYQQDPSCDYGVFGLNFFQSMYVSVHKALNGCHFVQMAPQWPENIESDLRDYGVPGM
ncbi:uncharacterized protein C8Q71DRAFT_786505 [Rhodofomes roseus]|uniref:Peptidase A1 domain-containing protein n=1 Tax=Rhodofomes roseus TaxID=34475 RepID=A0ABQ8K0S4_9APHY|nr:uncharacterized protein C8Q71DRAFT_786505 [Rhodofomes roseus]KAH9830272.1 hypothetical protein C8Q71DRAFT_786505 [Rhodofomes roseus]